MYYKDTLKEPDAILWELRMGLLWHCLWVTKHISIFFNGYANKQHTALVAPIPTHFPRKYRSLQINNLPTLRPISNPTLNLNSAPPQPIAWQPLNNPKLCIYTYRWITLKRQSATRGPSHTLPHIHYNLYRRLEPRWNTQHYESGTSRHPCRLLDQLRHYDNWIKIFTDSQTSLHGIQNQLQRPCIPHNMPSPQTSHSGYSDHTPIDANLGLPTKHRKIEGHVNIKGNDY